MLCGCLLLGLLEALDSAVNLQGWVKLQYARLRPIFAISMISDERLD